MINVSVCIIASVCSNPIQAKPTVSLHDTFLSFPYLLFSPPFKATLTRKLSAVGKTLAYTSCKFTNMKDEIVARGSHTKFVAVAWRDEKNITEELRPELLDREDGSRSLNLPPGA